MSYKNIIKDVANRYQEEQYLSSCSVAHFKDTCLCSDCGSDNVEFDYEIKYERGGGHIEEYYCLDCKSTEEIVSYHSSMSRLADTINEYCPTFEYNRIGNSYLKSEQCFKDKLNLQNEVLNKAYYMISNPKEFNLITAQINELKACVVFVFDELASKENKCPTDCDNMEYIETIIGGELEHWGCNDCKKSFNVSINIERDFNNKEVR